MSFHQLSGMDRYGEDAMAGDLAEGKVSQLLADMGRPCQSFGPRRVSTERAQHMTWTPEIRHAPDFLGWGRFIEVQGSNGTTIIFKKDKLQALAFWDTLMPVFFAIYLQSTDEVMFCDLAAVLWSLSSANSKELVLDVDTRNPKEAWSVPVSVLKERMTVDAFAAHKATRKK